MSTLFGTIIMISLRKRVPSKRRSRACVMSHHRCLEMHMNIVIPNAMEATHASRRYVDGNGLWACVMGAGNRLVVHARYALAGGGYGQVIGSLAGNRI